MLLLCGSVLAKPSATVDRTTIRANDLFTLTLSVDKNRSFESPDFSALEQDFRVLNTQQSSSTSIVNAEISSKTEWLVTLTPKRKAKSLVIPPIKIAGQFTDPIRIKIDDKPPPKAAKGEMAYLRSSIDKNQIYAGSQLLYTLKVFYRGSLTKGTQLTEPEPDGASLQKLDERQYQTVIGGLRYTVIEYSYALFPNKTGALEIPPALLDARIGTGRRQGLFSDRHSEVHRSVSRSNNHSITVNALPFSNGDIFAASNVQLSEKWSNDAAQISVGDSLSRTISISAKGAMASQLPPLFLPKVDGIKFYNDQPNLENQTSEQGITGHRTENMALVATRPGVYVLPKISLQWFDVNQHKLQTATLPERTITVLPPAGGNSEQQLSTDIEPIVQPTVNIKTNSTQGYWEYTAYGFALLWLLTLMAYLRKQPKPLAKSKETTAGVISNEQEAFSKLATACKTNNGRNALAATVSWAKIYWPKSDIQSLQDCLEQPNAEALTQPLNELESALYGAKASSEWYGKNLLAAVKRIRSQRPQIKQPNTVDPLYS